MADIGVLWTDMGKLESEFDPLVDQRETDPKEFVDLRLELAAHRRLAAAGTHHEVEGALDLGHAAGLVDSAEVGEQHLHFADVLAGLGGIDRVEVGPAVACIAQVLKRRLSRLREDLLEMRDAARELTDSSGLLFPSPLKPGHPLSWQTLLKLARTNELVRRNNTRAHSGPRRHLNGDAIRMNKP